MEQMSKLEQQLSCTTCPWNKYCIEPPVMTEEEVKAQIEKGKEGDDKETALFGGLINALVFAGKDREARICPIFAQALRSGPELSQKIKDIMKGNSATKTK